MSAQNDDASALRVFLILFGALAVFTASIMAIANVVAADLNEKRDQDAFVQAAIAERIKPVGEVNTAQLGAEPNTAEITLAQQDKSMPTMAEAPSASDTANNAKGKEVYDLACMACHAAGIAGAPKLGDVALWSERLQEGIDVLYTNAIKGKGAMPPKGGRMNLTDEEIKAAVDYMLAQSK